MKKYKNISQRKLIIPNYGVVKPGEEFKCDRPLLNSLLVEIKEEKKPEIKVDNNKKEEEKKL
jgi:hypothetical protein